VSIEGIDYAGIEAKLDRVQGANVWLTMGLREGKNREIKRVLEHLGLAVNRLIRLSFGPFQLGELAEGDVEEIKTRILRDQIGTALAAEAGCDFDGPIISSPESFALLAHPQHIARPHHRPSHERANGRQRAFERDAEDELPPRKDRPPPRARKHISALRADQKPQQGRRPIARSTTADRKGRDVAVERVSSQRPTIRSGKSRNEKRFSQERAQQNRAERSERPTHHGDGNRSASNRTASTKNAPTRSGPNRGGPNRGGPNKDRPNRGPSKRGGPQRPRRFD
jgi:23S rRNA pseudouridine2605 synthase